jgi:serine/threonine-protein kinase
MSHPLNFGNDLCFTAILSSIQWVAKTHKEAVENEIRLCEEALRWFDNMKIPVPTWYLKDFYIQWTDGVPYKPRQAGK